MGGVIFGSTTVQGRTFDNIKIQTSAAGVPRPIIFGRARPVVGNIIATTAPKIVKKKEKQRGGKGGPSVKVANEYVYRTYAIRICEGPVTGIRRVWINNELAYHRDSTDPTQIENNQAFLEKAEFFLGGWDQMPSSVMQAAFGVANVHAYRGTCYLVVDNDDLTGTGGAIPQYAFEVERAEGFALTSRLYELGTEEAIEVEPSVQSIELRDYLHIYTSPDDVIEIEPAVQGIELKDLVKIYSPPGHEVLEIEPAVTGFELKTVLHVYPPPAHEVMELEPAVQSIQLDDVLITYTPPAHEVLEIEPVIDSITLETA